jgi:hypothetical protein
MGDLSIKTILRLLKALGSEKGYQFMKNKSVPSGQSVRIGIRKEVNKFGRARCRRPAK